MLLSRHSHVRYFSADALAQPIGTDQVSTQPELQTRICSVPKFNLAREGLCGIAPASFCLRVSQDEKELQLLLKKEKHAQIPGGQIIGPEISLSMPARLEARRGTPNAESEDSPRSQHFVTVRGKDNGSGERCRLDGF